MTRLRVLLVITIAVILLIPVIDASQRTGNYKTGIDRQQDRSFVPPPRLGDPPRGSKPHVWQLREALPAPKMPFDPDAPVVDVAAEAALAGEPAAGDLDPTIDVQITQEIIDKATELGTVEAIYEFVRNECEFQAYYGSQKGSVETLRQRAGNDYDLASLLIALLRASGIPARYGEGDVEMTVEQATSWFGVDDGAVAGSVLFTGGMEGISIIDGGQNVVAVRAHRIWVEAWVSRGFGDEIWVPLDPAFATREVQPAQDIPEAMGFAAQAFVDEYWDPTDGSALPRPETLLDLMQQQVTDWLDANQPGTTLEDVLRGSTMIPQTLGLLPASLPYIARSRDGSFSEIPADRRYQVRFHLYDGATNLIDHTVNLPEVAGRRITIDYVGATPADEAIIESNGGIYGTPPSLVDLSPVLRLDGQDLAIGAAGVGMGLQHGSDLHFLAPSNASGLPNNVVPSISNTITTGAAQAIGLSIDGLAEGLLNPLPAEDLEGMASLRFDTAMDYLASVRNAQLDFGQLMHAHVTTGVANAIVEDVVRVTFNGDVPQTFDWIGLRVDADRSIVGVWPVDRLDPPGAEPKDFLILSGAEGSLLESRIYEDTFNQDSVSTIKILQLATDAGVTVYKRWSSLPLPPNTHSASDIAAMEAAILSGRDVTFPADPMTFGDVATGQWTGTGWIAMDPSNGAAGYIISGGNNGGATIERWPPEAIDLFQDDRRVTSVQIEILTPAADSPDPDAIFMRTPDENLVFEFVIHVTYDDASMATLPGGGERYRRVTRNTTRSLRPGNYQFVVWIGVRVWIFNIPIAFAARDVSVVGVQIVTDDGTANGSFPPPRYLQAQCIHPRLRPSVPVLARVIPATATDGTALAQGYAWSGSALVNFSSLDERRTDVESAGNVFSSSLRDTSVDVVVDLPGGKQARGVERFDTRHGRDVQYRLTVFGFDMAEMNLIQGGNYGFVGDRYTVIGQPAISYEATARIRPDGVDCNSRWLRDMQIGIMQDIPSEQGSATTWDSPMIFWLDDPVTGDQVAPPGSQLPVPTTLRRSTTFAPEVDFPVNDGNPDPATFPLYDVATTGDALAPPEGCPGATPALATDTPTHGAEAMFSQVFAVGTVPAAVVTWSRVNTTRQVSFRAYPVAWNEATEEHCALRERPWEIDLDSAGPAGDQHVLIGAEGPALNDPSTGTRANFGPFTTTTDPVGPGITTFTAP